MAVCEKCGAPMDDGALSCPICHGAGVDANDAQNNKVMGILAYLGILVLVPLLAAKESPFAQYHAKQGLTLCIAEIAISIVTIIPFIGWIIGLLGFVTLALAIIGIVNVTKGEMKPLPIIGGITLLQ